MAIEIKELHTPDDLTPPWEREHALEGYCLRCTTTGLVFGPTLDADEGTDRAEEFLQWTMRWHGDPRGLTPQHLTEIYHRWREEHPA